MKYSGMAGGKLLGSTARTGLHVSYGHRVIKTENGLPSRGLPPAFYGEINLSSDWKKSLTSTKNDIGFSKHNLLLDVEEKLNALLDSMDSAKEDYRMEILSAQLAASLSLAIVNVEIDGDYGEGEEIPPKLKLKKDGDSKVGDSKDGDSKPKPPPRLKKEATPEGKFGGKKDAPPFGLSIEFDGDITEDIVYRISASDAKVTIYLNKNLEYINTAMKSPVNSSAMWGVVTAAIVEHVFQDTDKNINMLKGLKMAKEAGATDADLKQLAYFGMLNEVPKLKEPTTGELKGVS